MAILAGGACAFARCSASVDSCEKAILLSAVLAAVALGWFCGWLRVLVFGAGFSSLVWLASYSRHLGGFGAD